MDNAICTASMTSQTYAQKAKRALERDSIYSRVIRLDGERSRSGCAYGIEFDCAQLGNVQMILNKNRIRSKHFYRGEEEI